MSGVHKKASLAELLEVLEHETNGIKTVLLLWHGEIPLPVKRSIGKRVRHQIRVMRKIHALLPPS